MSDEGRGLPAAEGRCHAVLRAGKRARNDSPSSLAGSQRRATNAGFAGAGKPRSQVTRLGNFVAPGFVRCAPSSPRICDICAICVCFCPDVLKAHFVARSQVLRRPSRRLAPRRRGKTMLPLAGRSRTVLLAGPRRSLARCNLRDLRWLLSNRCSLQSIALKCGPH
jgi:hypothetical protein